MMNFVTLTRVFALVFLFLVALGSAALVGSEIIAGKSLDPYALAIVSSGISYSLILLGIHLGNNNPTGGASLS